MSAIPLQEKLRTRTGMAVVLATVALVSAVLYLPATRYSFVWDDETLIAGNSLLAHSRPAEIFSRGFWAGSPEPVAGPAAAYYRPLVTLSFRLDQSLSRTNPHWFHAVNLLLYALAAVAVTLVLWELLHSGVWALLGGLLFAAHSSHVESVAFVSGRTDVMLTLFTSLAAFALLRSFRKHNRWWWLAVPPAFGLALLSKETAVLFPLLVALAPLLIGVRYDRRYWLLVLMTLAVLVGYLLLRAVAVPVQIPIEGRVGIWCRLAAVANTIGLYIKMFFWPFEHRAKYPANYAFFVPTQYMLFAMLFIVSVPLLALKRRFAATLWGYAWTIAFLLPVANIASIGPLAAERLLAEGKLSENPLLHAVAAVSVGIVNSRPLLDLCYVEDAAAAVDFNLVMNSAGEFIELQGTGEEAAFSEAQLGELLALGKIGIRQLLDTQQAALA